MTHKQRHKGRTQGTYLKVGLILATSIAMPAFLSGQRIPTLRDLGAEYVSRSGAVQISLSGQMDLEAFALPDHEFGLTGGTEGRTLGAPRLRLFTDLFIGDALYGLVEVRADRGAAPRAGVWEARVEQAFLRISNATGALSLQLGRFASPFGSYALRHLTSQDPFVVPPLFYDYRTMMCAGIAPPGTGSFLGWQDRPEDFRAIGAPPVWGVPYQWGAMIAGARGTLTYRLAAMNSAPSSDPSAWGWDAERFRHPSWVAGLGLRVSSAWSVGASFNRGPWLEELKSGSLPETRPGSGPNGPPATRWDFTQTVVALDVTYAAGPVMARMEVIRDQWQVPNMDQAPVEVGASLEVQADIHPGVSAAVRVGALDFRPVKDGAVSRDWDHDAQRLEASLGYRLERNAGFILSAGTTPRRSDQEGRQNVLGGRFWVAF